MDKEQIKQEVRGEYKCPKCGSDMKQWIAKVRCRNLDCRYELYIWDLLKIIASQKSAIDEVIKEIER